LNSNILIGDKRDIIALENRLRSTLILDMNNRIFELNEQYS